MLLQTAERPKRRFPRSAKVISRAVWHFRARRKSFPERFGISALGESRFPNGLVFLRMAKVISRMVWCKNIHKGISIVVPIVSCAPIWPPTNHFLKVLTLAGLPQITFKRFGISAHGESRFPNGLAFPRLAKVVSRMVWHFRAWRKLFPEGFGVSAHGESRFPNGLVFPRMAKVFS